MRLFALPAFVGLLALLPLARAEDPVRVACLGDSITAGAKVASATESYPAQLQGMLGEAYLVKNFGVGGATLWHGGRPNAFQQLPGVTAFLPRMVIVAFGINDTRSRDADYWSHFADFEPDLRRLISTLLDLPSKPSVLLCLPTANFADLPGMAVERRENVAERLPRLIEVNTKLRAICATLDPARVRLVDLHAATKTHPELYNIDGVHLNPAGYRHLAETLTRFVTSAGTR